MPVNLIIIASFMLMCTSASAEEAFPELEFLEYLGEYQDFENKVFDPWDLANLQAKDAEQKNIKFSRELEENESE